MKSPRLFARMPNATPPDDLLGKILARIERERVRTRRATFYVLMAAAGASTAALVFALSAATASFSRSGGSAFLKLLVTDTGAVAASWQDFAYSVLETLPAGGLAIALLSATLVAIILRALIRATRAPRLSTH